MKLIRNIILISLFTGIAVSGLIYANVLYYSAASAPQKSDVLIVLGCQIWGRSPSPSLKYRLEKSLELYKKDYADYIIVSGGQGSNEITTESSVMKEWLVKRGVSENIIFEESKSTSTYENLKYSKDIMYKHGFKTAVIVSNDFHIFRSLMLAKRLGIKATGAPARSVDYLRPYYRLREVASFIKSYIFDR